MNACLLMIALMAVPGVAVTQAASPATTSAPAVSPTVSAATLKSVVHALGKGDVPALAHLYTHPPNPASRVLAAMSLERIHYHLAQATQDARICEHALIKSQPNIAFFCAEFANGDIRLAKGERAADADERSILQRFRGKLPERRLDGIRRYLAGRTGTPPLKVQRPAKTVTIPVGRLPGSDMRTIQIEANGTSLALVIDTGSGVIALDSKWARKLGVRLTSASHTINGVLSRGIHVRDGIMDKVRIGNVTMEHVPVIVVPGKQRLIGIDILRHLGIFRLGRHQITVYGNDAKLPSCRQPMLIASGPWGQHIRLLTAVRINHALYTPLVDSGSTGFLTATQAALDKLKSWHTARVAVHGVSPTLHQARADLSIATVVIGHQPFRMAIPVFEDARVPWSFMLGSGALHYMDFFMDFKHHHTCLLVHDNLH